MAIAAVVTLIIHMIINHIKDIIHIMVVAENSIISIEVIIFIKVAIQARIMHQVVLIDFILVFSFDIRDIATIIKIGNFVSTFIILIAFFQFKLFLMRSFITILQFPYLQQILL